MRAVVVPAGGGRVTHREVGLRSYPVALATTRPWDIFANSSGDGQVNLPASR